MQLLSDVYIALETSQLFKPPICFCLLSYLFVPDECQHRIDAMFIDVVPACYRVPDSSRSGRVSFSPTGQTSF